MKKFAIILTAALTALASAAQPILVGHRGSNYGVENTAEAFQNGVNLGYKYLETDIKVTKDLKFVCTHDDNTERLGDKNLTIASSNLEDLLAVKLTQTRNPRGEGQITYTGRLCTLQEYMQIAKDGGIGCVVELKWATGINSNDCSNIPKLIAAIDEMGMRDRVIILTSMKPCLEYIRTNYPDIELQFLTGQYWASHFDWCVNWKIDVDIQAGYFDKQTVKKYHSKGLKVNMWTANGNDKYTTYGNMGCDMITTDNLDGHNLPVLDIESQLPENYIDYPVTDFEPAISSKYEMLVQGSYYPAEVKAMSGVTSSAAFADGSWAVLGKRADESQALYRVDAAGKATALSLTGVPALGAVSTTADGALVAAPAAYSNTTGESFKLYMWRAGATKAEVLLEISAADMPAAVSGDALATSGTLSDLKTYVGAGASVLGVQSKGATVSKTALCSVAYSDGVRAFTTSPATRDNFTVAEIGQPLREYTFNWDKTVAAPGEAALYGTFENVMSKGVSFARYGEKVYMASTIVPMESRRSSLAVFDATSGIASMPTVSPSDLPAAGDMTGNNSSSVFIPGTKANTAVIKAFYEGVGFVTYAFDPAKAVGEPVDLELVLERQWIFSNTTDNHPGNIDGTNAQQGTAVNGRFYINNCVEKKIHIFDATGYLGAIPGGSGWGCARDDAGNIIVRDDKLKGTTHSFIIYAAGATPEAYSDTVTFSVDVPVAGQTNFISASGNLLGAEGGHIYLYPNKATEVNIITVANGAVTRTHKCSDLAMTGSTAGYVFPLNDDVENWLYQIRNTGIYGYYGGTNKAVSTERASTTAPARNSTGGCCMIMEDANRILVHNSGANYKGGFTVRDITMDKVIASVDPIGALGYETGGNYSTFNWLIPERKGYANYVLYQYCPANGIAMYRLHNPKTSGISESEVAAPAKLAVVRTGSVISAPGAEGLTLYSASGMIVADTCGDSIDTASLAPGIYLLRASDGTSCKIAL